MIKNLGPHREKYNHIGNSNSWGEEILLPLIQNVGFNMTK